MFVGIDISKLSFDAAILFKGDYHNRHFDNNLSGFSALLKWVMSFKQTPYFCLEATGIYSLALAKHLHSQQHNVIVVNPIQTHAFAKMEMSRNKTDKADAMSIARYCQYLHDKGNVDKSLFTPRDPAFERVQFLVTRLDQLNKMRSQENNRLDVSLDKSAVRSVAAMLTFIDKQIVKIKVILAEIVQQNE